MAEAAVQSTGSGQIAGREATRESEATLERQFGWGGVFIFALCGIGLTISGLLPFSTIAGAWAGADLVGVLGIAAVPALIHACTYAAIGAVVGRNGADFLLTSRVLGRPLGFAASWTLVIFLALAGGATIGAIFQDTLPMFARILSTVFGNHLLSGYLDTYSSQAGVVLFGSFCILGVFSVLLLSPRIARYFLLVGVVLALGAWLISALQLANASGPAFLQAWDRAMGNGSYLDQVIQARSQGIRYRIGLNTTVMAGLAFSMALFSGYFFGANFAGEVKEPQKNLLRGSWAALLVALGVFALVAHFTQRLIPQEFLGGHSYLAQLLGSQHVAMPWLPFYTLLVSPSQPLFWFLVTGWVVPVLALTYTLLFACSRLVHTWAEEGLLAEGARFVHPSLRSPLIAVLAVSIVAEIGLVISALDGSFLGGVDPVFIIACAQVLPVLALIVLPFRKKTWFDVTPLVLQRKLIHIPLVSLFGVLSLVYLLGLIGSMLFYPGARPVNQITLIVFGVLFGTGLIWYIAQWFSRSASQADEKVQQGEHS